MTVPVHGAPRADTVRRAILRGAGLILVITVVARVAGFLRYLVFGASVGAGDVGTAYATANLLPNVLFEVVAGGALAAVVVPLVAGLVLGPDAQHHRGGAAAPQADAQPAAKLRSYVAGQRQRSAGEERTDHIISALLTWTMLITVTIAAGIIAFAAPLAQALLTADGSTASSAALGARLLRIFAVQLPLYGIAVVLGAYLQARKRFLWPALMPLLSSLVVMGSYRVYALLVPPVATATTIGDAAVAWLGWGTTAGVAAMALPVAIAAWGAGLRLRPRLTMPAGTGRKALALGGAGLGAVGAQQGVLALVLVLAMRAGGTGTLPVFQYAQALYLLPFAVLVVPLITAAFPHLSELRLVGDKTGFARAAGASVRTVVMVSVIGAATLFAAAPALEHFFRIIDRSGAQGVGAATAALSLGLAGYAVSTQCTRVLSAALRARDALLVGSIGWIIAAGLIIVVVLPSSTRTAAEAATVFALSIAGGMAVSGLVGLARISDILEAGDEVSRLRICAIAAPVALALAAVPGMVLARAMITTSSGAVSTVLAGMIAGLAAALVSGGLMALADPAAVRPLLERLRRAASR